MPKEFYKRESSKEWFTVSNAADKSSNDGNTLSPISSDSKMSFAIASSAVSVLWSVCFVGRLKTFMQAIIREIIIQLHKVRLLYPFWKKLQRVEVRKLLKVSIRFLQ